MSGAVLAIDIGASSGRHHVSYHAYPANTFALMFVLPLTDETLGLMHTVEKTAEILVKVLSMRQSGQPAKRQTIRPDDFRQLAAGFHVTLPERFLFDKP